MLAFYLPTSDLFIAIFSIESRFHLTTGDGLPDARHRNVTFEPSRTITSLELSESSIWGGTKHLHKIWNEKKTNVFFFVLLLLIFWFEVKTDKQRKNVPNEFRWKKSWNHEAWLLQTQHPPNKKIATWWKIAIQFKWKFSYPVFVLLRLRLVQMVKHNATHYLRQ